MSNISSSDPKRDLLRHTLATVAYRGGKALRNAPPHFSEFRAGEGVRTPGEILAHLGDRLEWALSIAVGQQNWHDSKPLAWEPGVRRFFAALQKFVDLLASSEPSRPRWKNCFKVRLPMRYRTWDRLQSYGDWRARR